jgi:tripartite-type tricarboxylate transporter receptor subunit TctC
VPHVQKISYDPIRDFAPISIVAVVPLLLVGHPSLPAKNVKELVALARSRPGQIDYVAGGYGGNSHLAMEHLLMTAGMRMTFVPYKSGNAGITDALSGRVPVMLSNVLVSLPHVRNGRFRAYGVSSGKRAAEVPDIPTIAEAGVPGYDAGTWYPLLAPARTPRAVVEVVHRDLVHVLGLPDIRERLTGAGIEIVGSTPQELARHIRDEIPKWARVIKQSGARAD